MSIELNGTEFKVSCTEQRSTGEYENVQPHASIEGEITAPGDLTDHRPEIRRKLMQLERDVQAIVEQAADNRVAIQEAERWDDPLSDDE